MTEQTRQTTENDHLEDAAEHTLWLEDVDRWRADHRRLIDLLAKSQAAVLEQDAAVEGHVRQIHAHEMHRLRHQLSMANAVETPALAKAHEQLETDHRQARIAHERMAKHHERVGRLIEELQRGLGEPM